MATNSMANRGNNVSYQNVGLSRSLAECCTLRNMMMMAKHDESYDGDDHFLYVVLLRIARTRFDED